MHPDAILVLVGMGIGFLGSWLVRVPWRVKLCQRCEDDIAVIAPII